MTNFQPKFLSDLLIDINANSILPILSQIQGFNVTLCIYFLIVFALIAFMKLIYLWKFDLYNPKRVLIGCELTYSDKISDYNNCIKKTILNLKLDLI